MNDKLRFAAQVAFGAVLAGCVIALTVSTARNNNAISGLFEEAARNVVAERAKEAQES